MDVYLSGLSKTYRGVTIINNINLFLSGGSFNILSGLNGSGKTTLIEIIAGITQPSNGNIFIGGTKVNNLPPFKRKVFYIPQTPHKYWQLIDQRLYCFIPNMTIKENLIEAMNSSGVSAMTSAPSLASRTRNRGVRAIWTIARLRRVRTS